MSLQKMITTQTTKVIFGACERYSKKKDLQLGDVQLSLGLKIKEGTEAEAECSYIIYENYKPVERMTYKQVLGGPDFLKTENFAPPFIMQGLVRYAQESGINPLEIRAICVGILRKNAKGKEEEAIVIYLYSHTQYLKQITIEEFIDLEKINMG
jgi:hypothetical protein